MPANVIVRQIDGTGTFIFENFYPNEPKANSIDTFRISKDGKRINGESVKWRKESGNGNAEIVTEIEGKDGNDDRSAVIKQTYLIGKKIFSITKEVMFASHKVWIKRHEFSYSR
ncbi:MAG: hypothetical protein ABI151_13770 [Chitinophagaceae bacterium]